MKLNISVLGWCLTAVVAVATPAYAGPEGQPCAAEPTDELIEYGNLRTCAITPVGELDIFRFLGAAGELVRIVATDVNGGFGGEVRVQLRNPVGTEIGVQVSETSATLELVLPTSGEYSILISESGNTEVLSYTLVLDRISPMSPLNTALANGIPLAGETISPVGDFDIYVIQGTAGDLIRLDGTDVNGGFGGEVCIAVRRSNGSVVSGNTCDEITVGIELTLDQDDVYTVIVSESGNSEVLSFDLLYSCLAGPCNALTKPRCDMDLSQAAYGFGQTVTMQTLRLVNPTSTALDLKLWITFPGFLPGSLASTVIPAGFDQTYQSLPFFEIKPSYPVGVYGVNCRFLSPVTGETLDLDLNSFDVP